MKPKSHETTASSCWSKALILARSRAIGNGFEVYFLITSITRKAVHSFAIVRTPTIAKTFEDLDLGFSSVYLKPSHPAGAEVDLG